MTEGEALDIMRNTFYLIITCAAPMLLTSLVVGLTVSVFQTVTSIQEQTLTFVPKIVSIFIALIAFGPFLIENISTYIYDLWSDFSIYIR